MPADEGRRRRRLGFFRGFPFFFLFSVVETADKLSETVINFFFF